VALTGWAVTPWPRSASTVRGPGCGAGSRSTCSSASRSAKCRPTSKRLRQVFEEINKLVFLEADPELVERVLEMIGR
jgi:hypothetical protein